MKPARPLVFATLLALSAASANALAQDAPPAAAPVTTYEFVPDVPSVAPPPAAPTTAATAPTTTAPSATTATTATTDVAIAAPAPVSHCVATATMVPRGSIGRDGNWHEVPGAAPTATGGGPCDASEPRPGGPVPQEPLVSGEPPPPIAAPPPPAIPTSARGGGPTGDHVIYIYRYHLRPLDRPVRFKRI